jgi:hypothetical protein
VVPGEVLPFLAWRRFSKNNSTEIVSGAAAATTKIDDDNQRLDPDYV